MLHEGHVPIHDFIQQHLFKCFNLNLGPNYEQHYLCVAFIFEVVIHSLSVLKNNYEDIITLSPQVLIPKLILQAE